jgi:hypothetical protein
VTGRSAKAFFENVAKIIGITWFWCYNQTKMNKTTALELSAKMNTAGFKTRIAERQNYRGTFGLLSVLSPTPRNMFGEVNHLESALITEKEVNDFLTAGTLPYGLF